MKCREYIRKIVDNNGDMEELSEILCECINLLEEHNRKEMCERLYILAYGEQLNEEEALDLVEDMEPFGEHWNMAQTTQVGNQYGWSDYSKVSWYYTMNMIYNDYHSVLGDDTSIYIKMARAFLLDKDAPKADVKVYRYSKI